MAVRYGNLPFAEQIQYLRDKAAIPTRAWTDIYGRENDQAFAVAGANRQAIVDDFQRSIQRMIDDGGTLEDFRKDFDQIVEKHGWSYNGSRGWRTRVIYETNLMQSYNAGREAQMADPRMRKLRPYGLYRHGGSEHPRPEHLANDGKVVPLDDPWWATWTPKNGWGCTCKKYMISRQQAEAQGYTVSESGPPIDYEEKTVGANGPSPRTVRVPKGIDPGFEHRPGDARVRAITPRPLARPVDPGRIYPERKAGDELPAARRYRQTLPAEGQPAETSIDAFLSAFGAKRGADPVRFTDAVGEPVLVSEALFEDGTGGHHLGGLESRLLPLLAQTLLDPDEIWTVLAFDGDRPMLRRRYLARWQTDQGEQRLLLEWGRDGWSGQTLEDLEALRQGVRLFKRGDE